LEGIFFFLLRPEVQGILNEKFRDHNNAYFAVSRRLH
jgi:hypothetical protein